jgi:thiamine biosynthesis lipoprotein ApbE
VLTAASFPSMGTMTTVALATADPAVLGAALDAARRQVAEIDRVCSRFRPDSELSRLNRAAGSGPIAVSRLLEEAIAVALETARLTGGLVDPTVGPCMEAIGYTVTFRDLPVDGPVIQLRVVPAAGWEAVDLDRHAHTVRLPPGVGLDLGASGKAWAADRAATAAARCVGAGVMVECGGDVAVAGSGLDGGWPLRIAERQDAPRWQDIHVFDGGVATSGTAARRWRHGGRELHHIVDPSTGLPADGPWRMVTVAAASCVEANAAATAAVVLGEGALPWLDRLGLPSRLVDSRGRIHRAGGWPAQG